LQKNGLIIVSKCQSQSTGRPLSKSGQNSQPKGIKAPSISSLDFNRLGLGLSQNISAQK